MQTICTCGRSTICAHKRNVDPNLIACAINADPKKCKFAKDADTYFADLKKSLEVIE